MGKVVYDMLSEISGFDLICLFILNTSNSYSVIFIADQYLCCE